MFFTRRDSPNTLQNENNHYWMSFSDMMSGMLLIFILVCIVLMYKISQMDYETRKMLEEAKQELAQEIKESINDIEISTHVRTAIVMDMARELTKDGIRVEVSENQTILRIPESSLHFATGSFEIPKELEPMAEKIGRALFLSILKDERWRYLDTVFIEGHTDSRNADNLLKFGNWQLSTLRAISLWTFWTRDTDYGEEMAKLSNREGHPLFSVSGYADSRRVEENEINEDAMRRNRRIDIRFSINPPTAMDVEEILKRVEPGR